LGRLAARVNPNVDEYLWNRSRNREMAQLVEATLTAGPLPSPRLRADREAHVVVIPMDGPERDTYRPAGGNFFFEIAQAAREYAGDAKVSVFCVEPGEPSSSWHRRLALYLGEVGATHLIAQVEKDPAGNPEWTWDALWAALLPVWDGVFLGTMFDSSYRWLTIPVRRMARMSDRFMLVDICMPMDGQLVKGRPEVGPVNMPMSTQALGIIDETAAGRPKIHDVTFIGALYPYRVALIESLEAAGLRVSVNPHRIDAPHDLEGSRANQPTYVDYMVALAQSHMTINFSQSSAGPYQQLKTRVLEASAMGCLVLTDDVDRTERFWVKGVEFDHFSAPEELPALVASWLGDPARLAAGQAAAKDRARSMNSSAFWGGIDAGLARRGLPAIGAATSGMG
jgi:hypothetical protein